MKYKSDKHGRHSIRLKGYDYSQAGAYFVTICAQNRECLFGDIGQMVRRCRSCACPEYGMRLNDAGQMVHRIWNDLPVKYPDIETDEFIVMPNHMHGIIVVGAPLVGAHFPNAAVDNAEPRIRNPRAGTRPAPTLGDVVGAFKSITTHQYADGVRQKNWQAFNTRLWQRNYYEHVIRDEDELHRIRTYITKNPMKWDDDENNPVGAPLVGAHSSAFCGCPSCDTEPRANMPCDSRAGTRPAPTLGAVDNAGSGTREPNMPRNPRAGTRPAPTNNL